MNNGVIWPTTRGKWNAGVYRAMAFGEHVSKEAEWDSDCDTSKFHVCIVRVSRAEAEKFLRDNGAVEYEVLGPQSHRLSGLNRLAKACVT